MDMCHVSLCQLRSDPGSLHQERAADDAPVGCAMQQSPDSLTTQPVRLEQTEVKGDNFPQIGALRLGGTEGPRAFNPTMAMTKEEECELREQLARLLQEHRDLDAAITALEVAPGSDLLQVQ